MKLLIVGSNRHYAIENEYEAALTQYCEVSIYPIHVYFEDKYNRSILHKLWYKLSLNTFVWSLNKLFLDEVLVIQPDVIWVFKGMEILPNTLIELKRRGTILLNYNADHPIKYTYPGSGNILVKKGIPHYHHHFSYSLKIVNDLNKQFNISASWLPFAVKNQGQKLSGNEQLINKVCFIGNPDKIRADTVKFLLYNDIPVDVYGNDWGNFITNHNLLTINYAIYGEEFNCLIQQYKAVLNIFRPHNENSHNMRTFEIPAAGGVQLAPYSEEHKLLFKENDTIFLFHNLDELLENAQKLINASDGEIREIQQRSFAKMTMGENDYAKRAEQVFTTIKQLKTKSIKI